ncbi:hypothetical protein HXX01_00510 [Candidatus Nomurabacteria bacterium]|nr:hypothetical protein [Candidatus Nomurabacteria bacterium]
MKFILPILFILISVLTFIFGVNPFYSDVKVLKSEIDIYNKALNNSTELQRKEDTLIKAYNEIPKTDKDRLNNFLPSTVNNIQFILEIERIANLHGMVIKDLKFQAAKASTDPNAIVADGTENRAYGVFPIEFTTEGDYDTFILFLKDLEYNLRLADVKTISFTVPEDNGKIVPGVDPNVYRYSLKVETYWLK